MFQNTCLKNLKNLYFPFSRIASYVFERNLGSDFRSKLRNSSAPEINHLLLERTRCEGSSYVCYCTQLLRTDTGEVMKYTLKGLLLDCILLRAQRIGNSALPRQTLKWQVIWQHRYLPNKLFWDQWIIPKNFYLIQWTLRLSSWCCPECPIAARVFWG